MNDKTMNGAADALPSIEVEKEGAHDGVRALDAKAAAKQEDAVTRGRAVIDAQIRQTVGIMIRGMLVSAPGVPHHEILNSICRVTGGLVAEAVIADLPVHFALRKGFKEEFGNGVNKAPLKQPGGAPANMR